MVQRLAMKRYIVNLTKFETEELSRLTSQGKSSVRKVMHAHILLKSDAGLPDTAIAEHLNVGVRTVERVRERCVTDGLAAALSPKPQPLRPNKLKLDGEGEARLVQLACSQPPEGRAKWTLRLLADQLVELEIVDEICHETVRQTLKKKRAEAMANSTVLHPAGEKRRVRARDGGRARGLSPSIRPHASANLYRRDQQATR